MDATFGKIVFVGEIPVEFERLVYVVRDALGDVRYIGRTINLARRMNAHLGGRNAFSRWLSREIFDSRNVFVSVEFFGNASEASKVERDLISFYSADPNGKLFNIHFAYPHFEVSQLEQRLALSKCPNVDRHRLARLVEKISKRELAANPVSELVAGL